MGNLVIRLDTPVSFYLIENNQLLLAKELDPDNVDRLLGEIGDYPVDTVSVYLKPDSRIDLDGIIIDRIIAETATYTFSISQGDYDFIKAVAYKFNAEVIKYYSAFRYYQTITTDGIVIDYYGDHNYIVANIFDGYYRSLQITSPERLQRTISVMNVNFITYASRSAIPELLNMECIDSSYSESLAFLQFVMYGAPCYEIDVDTGEVFDYGDKDPAPKFHTLSPEERAEVLDAIKSSMPVIQVRKKRKLGIKDIGVTLVYLVASVFLALNLFAGMNINDDFTVLDTKIYEQKQKLEKYTVEKNFLLDSIEHIGDPSITERLMTLDSVVNNGFIMNVRFETLGMKITLFATDEGMKDASLADLGIYYSVESCVYEKDVVDKSSNITFRQYEITVLYP